MRRVILENPKDTTVNFVEGSRNAYIGYCTIIFNPDKASALSPQVNANLYALQITDDYDVVSVD
jgi:hypothetical protein